MFAATEKTINFILEGNELANSYVEMHKNARDFYIKNLKAMPKREHSLEALEVIAENLKIRLSDEELEKILILFPTARIKLAVYKGCSDTEVEDLVIEAVFVFITGCKLPRNKDEVDFARSLAYFHSQAKEMGYTIVAT